MGSDFNGDFGDNTSSTIIFFFEQSVVSSLINSLLNGASGSNESDSKSKIIGYNLKFV